MIPKGLLFRRGSGKNFCGQSWKQTGRTNRFIASAPTEEIIVYTIKFAPIQHPATVVNSYSQVTQACSLSLH